MKRLNEQYKLRRDLYDAIMNYDEYKHLITSADKNNFKNISYIDIIRHRINTLDELLDNYYKVSGFRIHEELVLFSKLLFYSDDDILENFKDRMNVEISHIEMKLIIQDIVDALVEFEAIADTRAVFYARCVTV